VEDAALPFDRRRHGMILGIGAAALVIESEDAVRERGMRGIVEVLATETANSAHHATRLDADHVSQVMERLLTAAERRFGINRFAIAPQTVFMSHETYTPARGGSASAEVKALRATFGPRSQRHRGFQHQGLHRPHHGRRRRGCGGGENPGARHRAAGAQLPGSRP
jgi:3-oxoacyl-(acyl-carrier-protein) synthase